MGDIASDREAAESLFFEALEKLQAKDPDSEVIELWKNQLVDACTEETLRRFGNLNFPFPGRENKTLVAHLYAGRYLAAMNALIWAEVRKQQEDSAVQISTETDLLDQLASATSELEVLNPKHELIELFRDRHNHEWFKPEIARRFRPRTVPFSQIRPEPDELCYAMMLNVMRWESRRLKSKQAA